MKEIKKIKHQTDMLKVVGRSFEAHHKDNNSGEELNQQTKSKKWPKTTWNFEKGVEENKKKLRQGK